MTLRRLPRHGFALIAFALLAVSAASCSKNPVATPKPLTANVTQTDADDIVQTLGTTISADNGGWYLVIKTLCDTLAVPPPAALRGPAIGTRALFSTMGTQNTFLIHGPSNRILYNLQIGYVRLNGSVTSAVALVGADGGVFTNANGVDGNYGCHTITVNSFTDSLLTIDNLSLAAVDTLEFGGIFEDSCFALVHSTFSTGSTRLWLETNSFDFNLRIPKSRLKTAPYPSTSGSEVRWGVEAQRLNSPARDDVPDNGDLIMEARMTFDGSSRGLLILADSVDSPTWAYRYTVDLNSGHVTRAN